MKQRLVDCYMGGSVNPGESYIIQNFSKVEYLVSKFAEKELNVADLEKSIEEHSIKITQTLLNTIFKGYKGKYSYDDYQMLLNKYCSDNKSGALTRSIYMLLPMLESCRSNEEWEGTLKLFPDVDKNSVEIYDISVRKMFDFYIQDKNPDKESLESFLERVSADIENNRERVGVYAINSCLARFVLILENRRFSSSDSGIKNIKARMKACWKNLNRNGKIDVCSLLGLSPLPDEPAWEIDADVRTYTFFPMFYDGCMPVYLDEKFEGNFSYDDRQKNDCFYDCLKNYAMKFRGDNSEDSQENYKMITEILLRDGHKNVVRQIFTDFIIRRYNEKKQNCVHEFWYGLLKCSDELKIMLVEGFLKNEYPSLDGSNEFDKLRIDLLSEIYEDCSESVKAVVKRTKDAVYKKMSTDIKFMYDSMFFELYKE